MTKTFSFRYHKNALIFVVAIVCYLFRRLCLQFLLSTSIEDHAWQEKRAALAFSRFYNIKTIRDTVEGENVFISWGNIAQNGTLRHNEALCEHLVDGCISPQGEEDAGMNVGMVKVTWCSRFSFDVLYNFPDRNPP